MIEVKVKIPKQVHEFLKNLYAFAKLKKSFEECLGEQIVWHTEASINSQLEGLIETNELRDTYGF